MDGALCCSPFCCCASFCDGLCCSCASVKPSSRNQTITTINFLYPVFVIVEPDLVQLTFIFRFTRTSVLRVLRFTQSSVLPFRLLLNLSPPKSRCNSALPFWCALVFG